MQKPVGGVAVMPLGADLLSKFRKDKTAKEGVAQRPVADVRFPFTFATLIVYAVISVHGQYSL